MLKYKEQLNSFAVISSLTNLIFDFIPAIAFCAYVGLGNVLDLPMALTAMQYFEKLIWGIS